jgi:hypothetical protein
LRRNIAGFEEYKGNRTLRRVFSYEIKGGRTVSRRRGYGRCFEIFFGKTEGLFHWLLARYH